MTQRDMYGGIQDTSKSDTVEKLMVALAPEGAGILAQEARGQSQVAGQDTTDWVQIPARLNGGSWDEYTEAGFVLGDLPDPTDPAADRLFRKAKLPEGWSMGRAPGDMNSYWTNILDADGFQRASIFYKAAFYDRDAFITMFTVPTTYAQDRAVEAIRDEPVELEAPVVEAYWRARSGKVRDGDNLVVVFDLVEWAPSLDGGRGTVYARTEEERTARRRITFAKDGGVVADERFDVSAEQAVEEARSW